MQLESLKVFCDVAKYRSFSQAATTNEVTQSAVSQIVSQLEKRFSLQFVDRSTRPLRLTEEGERFHRGCEEIVKRYEALLETFQQEPDAHTVVRVAAIYSVDLRDMHRYIEQFQALLPGGEVQIDYLSPDKVHERVMDDTVDLGLMSFARTSRELVVLPWRNEPFVLACAPSHPLAMFDTIPPSDISGNEFIAFDKGLVIRREVDRFLREHDVDFKITHEFDNIENIKKAVEAGAGVALLPEPALRPELASGAIRAIALNGCNFVRPMCIVHRKHRLNRATTLLIEILEASMALDNEISQQEESALLAGEAS
jgi:DNA-binding transcriptional LysR family regulator